MERPIMHPSFVEDAHPKRMSWRERLRPVWHALQICGRILFRSMIRRGPSLRIEVGSRTTRILRGVCYRMLFVPLLMAMFAAVLVYTGTHPPQMAAAMDPTVNGIYYDPVMFLAEDGVQLEGWMVPVMDARRVLAEKEKALSMRSPAVVLAHDFGCSRQQMLPLVTPLHEAGYVVLAVGLRGSNISGSYGSTFGLNESSDVKAAVDQLRKTPFVDTRRIAVIGLGTGGTASLLATLKDPGIAAMVIDRPVHSFDEVLSERIAPNQPYLKWIAPMCKWTFEIAYRVNARDMDLDHCFHELTSRPGKALPMLVFDGEKEAILRRAKGKQIVDFLDSAMPKVKDPRVVVNP